MMEFIKGKYKVIIVLLFWIGIWQILALLISQSLFLPTPKESFAMLIKLLPEIKFWQDIFATLLRVIIGLSISLIGGFVVALITCRITIANELTNPIMSLIKTLPIVSLILLFLVFIKSNNVPIIVCTMVCLPIAYTNIAEGLKNIDKKLVEMGKVYELKKKKIFTKQIFS